MKSRIGLAWKSRAPRERAIVTILAFVLAAAAYFWLVRTGGHARLQLGTSVAMLREQAVRLEQQAGELERLRTLPSPVISQTDLRTLVQAQAGAAGLSTALLKVDVPEPDTVVVIFGAVAFADWLNWVTRLNSQHIRLDACKIDALSAPGMVNVTATLRRATAQ